MSTATSIVLRGALMLLAGVPSMVLGWRYTVGGCAGILFVALWPAREAPRG